MSGSEAGSDTLCNPVQPWKAAPPTSVTPAGNATADKAVQPLNAAAPMRSSEAGSDTAVSPSLPLNACEAMPVTRYVLPKASRTSAGMVTLPAYPPKGSNWFLITSASPGCPERGL